MSTAVDQLAALPGVTGICLHRGADMVECRLPEHVTGERAAALCAAVAGAFATYAGAGRQLREAWFEFPGLGVLAMPAPWQPEEMLTFFLTDRSHAGTATGAARSAAPAVE